MNDLWPPARIWMKMKEPDTQKSTFFKTEFKDRRKIGKNEQ